MNFRERVIQLVPEAEASSVHEVCQECGYFNPSSGRFYRCHTASCIDKVLPAEKASWLRFQLGMVKDHKS